MARSSHANMVSPPLWGFMRPPVYAHRHAGAHRRIERRDSGARVRWGWRGLTPARQVVEYMALDGVVCEMPVELRPELAMAMCKLPEPVD